MGMVFWTSLTKFGCPPAAVVDVVTDFLSMDCCGDSIEGFGSVTGTSFGSSRIGLSQRTAIVTRFAGVAPADGISGFKDSISRFLGASRTVYQNSS